MHFLLSLVHGSAIRSGLLFRIRGNFALEPLCLQNTSFVTHQGDATSVSRRGLFTEVASFVTRRELRPRKTWKNPSRPAMFPVQIACTPAIFGSISWKQPDNEISAIVAAKSILQFPSPRDKDYFREWHELITAKCRRCHKCFTFYEVYWKDCYAYFGPNNTCYAKANVNIFIEILWTMYIYSYSTYNLK